MHVGSTHVYLINQFNVIENGKRKIIHDDYTGKIENVNSGLLTMLLDAGYMTVIAPMVASEKGETLNVDASHTAAVDEANTQSRWLIT